MVSFLKIPKIKFAKQMHQFFYVRNKKQSGVIFTFMS